jgi:mannose-1-phosphate guanylyltransferase
LKFVNDNGGIVTLGINPTKPETGYGYIQYDIDNSYDVILEHKNIEEKTEKVFKVKTFAEKPNLETAKAFVESGDFLWNSGMFIFRADTMMEEIKKSLPELFKSMKKLEENILSNDFPKILEKIYSQIKGISIDYGVMEKSNNVYTIKSHFDWSDVGSWDEIYNFKEKDSRGNVMSGRTVTIDTKNCLIINDQRISAVIGVEDLLIIDTDNGLLVCKRSESQKVKEVVDYLRRKGLEQYL